MRMFLVFLSVFLLLGSVGVKGQTLFGSEQIITTDISGGISIYAEDLDHDGDVDVLSASHWDDKIAWYENDGSGNFNNQHIISTERDGSNSVFAVDLNGDGNIDVVSASRKDNKIAWYENDGNGNFSSEKIISDIIEGPRFMYVSDLDGDSDIDIVATSYDSHTVSWYQNDGNGNFDSQLIISSELNHAFAVCASDLDNDGDNDVVSASIEDNKIAWYENDGNGNFGSQNIISISAKKARAVYATDINGDGNMDVLSASNGDEKIAWYENDGNGNFGNQQIISTNTDDLRSINATDLDNDGDIDVISASYLDGKIAWYENDGEGHFSEQKIISELVEANYVFTGDLDGDGDMDVISISHSDRVTWHENLLGETKISSFAFYDTNENGLYENTEFPLYKQSFLLNPSADITFTSLDGYSYFFVKNGEYQLAYEPSTLWESTSPETYQITVTDDAELPTYYFGFKPTRTLHRVNPNLNNSPTRCDREATYWLNYTNTGTTIANGTITLELDELMGFISSNPEPDLIEGRKLIWNFSELYPSFENKIHLQFQMPDFNSMGEILETQASIQLFNDNQELTYSKSTEYDSEVLCSYDPNDKLTRSNLLGQSEFAYIEDTIFYTIRFQNTGNDVAFNIRIEDILDKKLDLTTFHPITASHNYRTELNRETGLATFYFDDIMLPDSTTNEEGSHGFVMFGIASLGGIGDKTEIENTASIFFDFNPPIITNTATLTLIEQVETDIAAFHSDYPIRVFPNPFSDYTTIEVGNLPQGNYRLQVMDILGRKVRELDLKDGKVDLERGDLESGLYLVRILEEGNGRVLGSGKVLVE